MSIPSTLSLPSPNTQPPDGRPAPGPAPRSYADLVLGAQALVARPPAQARPRGAHGDLIRGWSGL